ncbi:unnamed protein product, partial [Aphanomyces euteiches]
ESKESWYAVVKELVERTQKPVLLFVKRSFPTLDHATAQWCFRQLVAEQIIRRHGRGRRYQMAPTSIPMADTTSKQAMGQAIHGLYNSSTALKPTARRRSQAINSVIQTTSMEDGIFIHGAIDFVGGIKSQSNGGASRRRFMCVDAHAKDTQGHVRATPCFPL